MFASSWMPAWVRAALFALATFPLATFSQTAVYAQIAPLCGQCQQIPARCTCRGVRPVAKTVYEQRQVVTYRDVPQIEYRTVTELQQVPKTVYRQITVDEGGYQLVWVSRPVTRQIAQTVYETKTVQKQVPVTVVRRVPQVIQQTVPRQVVEYQPFTFTTTAMIAAPGPVAAAAPACPVVPRVGMWGTPWPIVPPVTYSPLPVTTAASAGCATCPTSAVTAYSGIAPVVPATPPPVTLLPPQAASNGSNANTPPGAGQAPSRPPSASVGSGAPQSNGAATSAYEEWTPVPARSADDAGRGRARVGSRGPAVRDGAAASAASTSPADRLARGKFVPLRPRQLR